MKIQLPESPLTRENYFSFKEYKGLPVLHSSAMHSIYPGEGGSLKKLHLYLTAQKEDTKPHFTLGQLFHKYLENSRDFVVETDTRPEEGVVKVVNHMYENFPHEQAKESGIGRVAGAFPLLGGLTVKSARAISYQPRWGDEAIMKKIGNEGEKYWDFLCNAEGHHMLTAAQKIAMDGMSESAKNSSSAELIFSKDALHEVPILFQMAASDGTLVWCKALIDWLLIGSETDELTMIDFKTTSKPVGNFMYREELEFVGIGGSDVREKLIPGPFWGYRYYRQFAFYRVAVWELFRQIYPDWEKRLPKILSIVLPFESVAPFECGCYNGNLGENQGLPEIYTCVNSMAQYYKTLKKF